MFADKLFKKNRESVEIPFSEIAPLIKSPKDNHLKITRRAFRQYLKEKLGRKDVDRRIDGEPSVMNQLCDFNQENFVVKVTKKNPEAF